MACSFTSSNLRTEIRYCFKADKIAYSSGPAMKRLLTLDTERYSPNFDIGCYSTKGKSAPLARNLAYG